MLIDAINNSWYIRELRAYFDQIDMGRIDFAYKNNNTLLKWYIALVWFDRRPAYFINDSAKRYLFNSDWKIQSVDYPNWDLYIKWVIENWDITQHIKDIVLEREKINQSDLSGYHSWRTRDFSSGAKIRVWLEIERSEYPYRDDFNILSSKGWRAERDGSVRWWEYITPILDIDKAYSFVKEVDFILKNKPSRACWWHIHLSMSDYLSEYLYSRIKEYRPILWALYPSRALNSYCSKNWGWRYRDVIISQYWTVEFRIFPQLRSLKQLEFRLALIKFFATNHITSKEEAINKIWWVEFLSVLDIVYKTIDRKIEIISKIFRAYEIDENKIEEVLNFARIEIEKLRKNK